MGPRTVPLRADRLIKACLLPNSCESSSWPASELRREAAKQGPGETDVLRQPSDMESDDPRLSDEWSCTSRSSRARDCASLISASDEPACNSRKANEKNKELSIRGKKWIIQPCIITRRIYAVIERKAKGRQRKTMNRNERKKLLVNSCFLIMLSRRRDHRSVCLSAYLHSTGE